MTNVLNWVKKLLFFYFPPMLAGFGRIAFLRTSPLFDIEHFDARRILITGKQALHCTATLVPFHASCIHSASSTGRRSSLTTWSPAVTW